MNSSLKYLVIVGCLMLANLAVAQESPVGEIFKGQHALQNITVLPSSSTPTSITITWEMNGSRSAVITIPVNKIQLEFNQALASPFIRFRWSKGDISARPLQRIVDENVIYVLMVCKKEFWDNIATIRTPTSMVFRVEAEAHD